MNTTKNLPPGFVGLTLSDFAIESIIREGIQLIRTINTSIAISDILGRLTQSDLVAKYGPSDLAKFTQFIQAGDVNIVHSVEQISSTRLPCFSIHLMSDSEDEAKTAFNDRGLGRDLGSWDHATPTCPKIVTPLFTATEYFPETGMITCPDSADLSLVFENQIYIDGSGVEYKVLYPISNILGDKYFSIIANIPDEKYTMLPNLVNGIIQSPIKNLYFEIDYTPTTENIMVGVHTDNAIFTKMLYSMLRYIFYKNRRRFQDYNLELSKYNGSDFSLQLPTQPEPIYSRWITSIFIAYQSWHGDEIIPKIAINPAIGGVGPLQVIVHPFQPTGYTSDTGIVTCNDKTNLCDVFPKYVFTDAAGQVFQIQGMISNVLGAKQFQIKPGSSPNITAKTCTIKRLFAERVVAESELENATDFEVQIITEDDEEIIEREPKSRDDDDDSDIY